ncbi:hypothetical protein EDB92DRAFT_1949568 [Lactarius akahatsu]|uniref:Uncharacterized protein n=1 Tax=Lactarius akahatsu TaxID=416441 RepID=A0AAD4LBU9_9AGAM|nr:hypothetical protein EDB92DRAFT_1949568 [Lactarius akahatsu]
MRFQAHTSGCPSEAEFSGLTPLSPVSFLSSQSPLVTNHMPRQSSLPPRDIFRKFIRKPETTSTNTSPETPPCQPEPSTSNSTLNITEAFTSDYEITPRPNHAQSIPGSFSPQTEPSPQSSIPFLTLVAQSYKHFVPPSLIPVLKSTISPSTSCTPATSSNLPLPAQSTSLIVSAKARSLSNPQKPLLPPPTSFVTASLALAPNLASVASSLSLNTPSTVSSITTLYRSIIPIFHSKPYHNHFLFRPNLYSILYRSCSNCHTSYTSTPSHSHCSPKTYGFHSCYRPHGHASCLLT